MNNQDRKNNLYKVLSIVSYFISFLMLLFFIKIKVNSYIYLNTKTKIFLLLLICLFIYIGGYLLVKKLNYDKKILKINLIIYFLIYIVMIFSLTLFDEIYGRQGLVIVDWNKHLLNKYLKTSFNIIPFNTIKLFIDGYKIGIVNFKNFSINVIGNLLAFMPFGIFLPLIFKCMKKFYKFLIVMILLIIVIELLQFITLSGSCDIDDLILNVLGACIIYFIFKLKKFNSIINRLFLME